MKIQYKEKEVKELIINNNFVEIAFDIDNLENKTSKIELIAFERKIKFELIYINKKYSYLHDEIDPIILQIMNVDNVLLSTLKIEPYQDLLYIPKQITNDYDDLILLIVPKNKEGLKSDFNIKTLKNFTFLLFKR
ncbi:hypothetical protein HMPREF1984_00092 [Leptotrichia sp. oral taxon 215 str. W9775]|jgi:hypothetical protein|uniref:hypothetical protein n=1 Tax=Leptotrichia sp. oral taxon 215 TaxID=712359 RepID=UPI0003AE5AD2|nr:hypothetical protein [Leptotrichia sp. oral taxon 215]ERK69041.1 hypothetical protein HMPREF1984_00092 [Leptotrichia sp. oral taxon 215 str. W9775]DAO06286.1 MAG TPA: hypothetical protein [Caudoviricetes sp.]DAP99711.1 MAG TPA: hypothetical protein [Caudoviricetes sp.]DAR96015.1 MAG TPA: hypothetical protein [Caudoviricetes sp.]